MLSWLVLIGGIGALITGHINFDYWPKDARAVGFFLGLMLVFAPLRDD
jgi:hypothetical protein